MVSSNRLNVFMFLVIIFAIQVVFCSSSSNSAQSHMNSFSGNQKSDFCVKNVRMKKLYSIHTFQKLITIKQTCDSCKLIQVSNPKSRQVTGCDKQRKVKSLVRSLFPHPRNLSLTSSIRRNGEMTRH